jgi:riboflavin kinase/FMN adenylyltransferase
MPTWTESTVCIGVFDGVHLGHRAIIEATAEDAIANKRVSVVVTFDRHPIEVLRPEGAPPRILSQSLKLARIEQLGIACCVVLRFDDAFASMSPDDFIKDTLIGQLNARKVVVGHDFAFGKNREGTGERLSNFVDTTIVEAVQLDGRRVSSTEIRSLIAAGDIARAARLLGGPCELSGVAVRGREQGRLLGFPTVNFAFAEKVLMPLNGVYAGECDTRVGTFKAAVSIGDRPTYEGAGFAVEAHLLDYPGDDLYGTSVRLRLDARLRDEEQFDREEDLIAAIERDVQATRGRTR